MGCGEKYTLPAWFIEGCNYLDLHVDIMHSIGICINKTFPHLQSMHVQQAGRLWLHMQFQHVDYVHWIGVHVPMSASQWDSGKHLDSQDTLFFKWYISKGPFQQLIKHVLEGE